MRVLSLSVPILTTLGAILLQAQGAVGASLPSPATANVQVTVTVPAFVKLEIQNRSVQVTLTQADIEQGYIDLVGATRMTLWTNSRRGASLMVRPVGITAPNGTLIPFESFLYRVEGDGAFRPFQNGDQVVYRGKGVEVGALKAIDYRIKVGWGMEPGTYRLDLTYTAILNE